MSILAVTFLIIGLVVLMLVLASIFKEHKRIIFWSGAIALFLTMCALFATGVFKPTDDISHNVTILGITVLMLGTSAALVIMTEQPEKLMWKKRKGKKVQVETPSVIEVPSELEKSEEQKGSDTKKSDILITEEGSLKGVLIPQGVNTPLARRIFSKAIDADFISVDGTHLVWNDSTVLLAYMCGRIYCKDKAEKVPHENKYCWEKGQDGLPNAELTRLFQREGIGQARLNRKSATAPKKFEEIDIFFERS